MTASPINNQHPNRPTRTGVHPALWTGLVVSLVLFLTLWISFQGDILGFYRIGTVLPTAPHAHPSDHAIAHGELGYDGQLFLTIAMDPLLQQPGTLDALDNPRYRYRRILFPALGHLLAFGQRDWIPVVLVVINVLCFMALTLVVAGFFKTDEWRVHPALFTMAIPGYWCTLLLTTSDLLAALLLALTLKAWHTRSYGLVSATFALAALTHETMLAAIGVLVLPLAIQRQWKNAFMVAAGCIPAILWNLFVLWHIPGDGSTSGFMENFSLPGQGIAEKLMAILSGPLSLKWIYDSAAFLLLCATLILVLAATAKNSSLRGVRYCAFAYAGFFVFSKMQILSYYIDFLRVFSHVILLLLIGLSASVSLRKSILIILGLWGVLALGFVSAYAVGLI